jgi:hypothetical protein
MTPFKKRDLPSKLNEQEFIAAIQVRPKKVLTSGNKKLRKTNTIVFTLPAYTAMVVEGNSLKQVKTCKSAGACAKFCFAQMGTYQFTNSMIAHHRNLDFVLNDPWGFKDQVVAEIAKKRKVPTIRIHDAGDFFNKGYRDLWFQIAKEAPEAKFYIYTKEVKMFKDAQKEKLVPANFHIVYSLGGKQDSLVDVTTDRHSKVFATEEECLAEGYIISSNDDANAADPEIKKLGLVFHAPAEGKKAFSKEVAA